MSNIDWSKLRKAADIKAEAQAARLAPLIAAESEWVEQERQFVAEQLEAIEDGEEVPGTEREWRDYRILVRAWKAGADGYPDSSLRPARPS
ncbi:hypothetical protein BOH74_20905 [Pseudomonas versuta]|uniref:Uncharacterized protein n=1 Tax=Pseudomonas versuta TaxID=1788301 RepID=A0A853ZTR6_9PSED|nr:hypothetical protein [Pseudomonas versuta]OKA18168.1 hypothetical protein BOH74_20905 [Pseudomonas versuta]